jgi:hypothetical protein
MALLRVLAVAGAVLVGLWRRRMCRRRRRRLHRPLLRQIRGPGFSREAEKMAEQWPHLEGMRHFYGVISASRGHSFLGEVPHHFSANAPLEALPE